MDELEEFISRIENFNTLPSSTKIRFFAYYVQVILKKTFFNVTDINQCFVDLNYKPYSNISSYLGEKSKGKNHIFLKGKNGYTLERKENELLSQSIGVSRKIKLTDDLFPISLLDNTRGYIIKIANQAIGCYDYGFYDACLVMIRKLLETLIIELFEKKKLESKIKNPQGQFFYLSDLIGALLSESSWSVGRNVQQGLIPIKKIADLSAHNRRFNANKSDIDKTKIDLRIVIEELVHLIDYSH